MSSVLALPLLYAAVVARFADEAAVVAPGTVSALDIHRTGTSVPSVHADPAPTGALSVVWRVTTGGTVGTTGIVYEVSVDGGVTWSSDLSLGVAVDLVLGGTGVRLDLAAGTLVAGDLVRFTTTAPVLATPVQVFGWREPAHRAGSMRIVWVPGDGGDLGEIAPPRNPRRNPRPLATVHELFTVFLEASDPAAPEDELAQYTAARLLFDAWLRAVYLASHGTYAIRSARWVDEKVTRRYGATLRVVGSIEAMVPDAPFESAPVDTEADVTTYLSEDGWTEGELDSVSAS